LLPFANIICFVLFLVLVIFPCTAVIYRIQSYMAVPVVEETLNCSLGEVLSDGCGSPYGCHRQMMCRICNCL